MSILRLFRLFRLFVLFVLLLALLCGCSGGQEIESCLFVLALSVDPAPEGNLTVTVKALSGTQEAAGQGASGGDDAQASSAETREPGYVVLSATAGSCVEALSLLSATTPRTVNLSQLREVVISRTLAESGAALSVLDEIHALYEANGEAVVVVTPDHAGDFIRSQYAMFGVRLSKYLQVLFDHFESLGTIPPDATLAGVTSAMRSGTRDAAAVYAASSDFSSTLLLSGESVTDRLPGHLPRTSPAENEYLGAAIFSGARMVGVLTGDETTMLRLLSGKAIATSFSLEGAMMQVSSRAKVTRRLIMEEGKPVLCADIRMHLTLSAGTPRVTGAQLAAQIEESAAHLMQRLIALGSDAIGFGSLAIRSYPDIPAWEAANWRERYRHADVRVTAQVILHEPAVCFPLNHLSFFGAS